jgi:hypothetical protein
MLKEGLHFFFSIHDYSNIIVHYTNPGMELAFRVNLCGATYLSESEQIKDSG